MLENKYRIKKTDFDIIYKKGRYFKNDIFLLNFLPNKKSYSQFAVVISAKTEKSSVKRNRMRRVIKELIKTNLTTIPQGYYFIISVKKPISQENELQKQKILLESLGKISV